VCACACVCVCRTSGRRSARKDQLNEGRAQTRDAGCVCVRVCVCVSDADKWQARVEESAQQGGLEARDARSNNIHV
jgi:hypothetical protein